MTVVQVESSNRGVPVMGLLWRKAVARKCPVFRTVTAEVRWVALAPRKKCVNMKKKKKKNQRHLMFVRL